MYSVLRIRGPYRCDKGQPCLLSYINLWLRWSIAVIQVIDLCVRAGYGAAQSIMRPVSIRPSPAPGDLHFRLVSEIRLVWLYPRVDDGADTTRHLHSLPVAAVSTATSKAKHIRRCAFAVQYE